MLALDVVRLEAGLILLEVDYTSARHAMNPEQNYSPFEIGLGRLVSFDKADFVGRLALEREQRGRRPGAPARRPPARLVRHRGPVQRPGPAAGDLPGRRPVARPGLRRRPQVGRVTSLGWSPILKQAIALGVGAAAARALGSKLVVEWTVEGRRGRVGATVVDLPFLDLPRKRAWTGSSAPVRRG